MAIDVGPWLVAAERVHALAAEHGDAEALVEALGLPPGFSEFAVVYGEHLGVKAGAVAALVAMGALLVREADAGA